MPVGNIFLSYRRIDTAGHAGRIFDRLNLRFPGRIFRDVDSIRAGKDFVKEIEHRLASCELLIVVIGPQWLGARAEGGGRRIDEELDFVRLEVATGLRKDIPVIPVLVNGATMPKPEELPEDLKPLAYRHFIEITEPDFDHDVKRLIEDIEELFEHRRTNWKRRALVGAGAAAPVLAALAFVTPWGQRTTVTPARLDAGPPPGSQSPTSRARPANAAAEKKKEASPTPAPTPAPTPTPPAPPADGLAENFPAGTWELSAPDTGDKAVLTIYPDNKYKAEGTLRGQSISGRGIWHPDKKSRRLVYFVRKSENDGPASYSLDVRKVDQVGDYHGVLSCCGDRLIILRAVR